MDCSSYFQQDHASLSNDKRDNTSLINVLEDGLKQIGLLKVMQCSKFPTQKCTSLATYFSILATQFCKISLLYVWNVCRIAKTTVTAIAIDQAYCPIDWAVWFRSPYWTRGRKNWGVTKCNGRGKSHNGTETETPTLALGICELH